MGIGVHPKQLLVFFFDSPPQEPRVPGSVIPQKRVKSRVFVDQVLTQLVHQITTENIYVYMYVYILRLISQNFDSMSVVASLMKVTVLQKVKDR